MRKLLFIFLLVSICFSFKAQVNLVPNPSFEDTIKTPYNKVGNKFLKNWHNLDSTNDAFCPINYYSKFCTTSSCTLSTNSFFSQNPKTGNAVIALQLYYIPPTSPIPAIRSLARVHLTQTLTVGKVYCAKMYVNLIENCQKAIDGLHMYFDNGILDTVTLGPSNTGIYSFVNPQVKQTQSVVINDTTNWIEVSGTFTATGNESYLTLGNFYTDAQTTNTIFNSTVTANWSSYIIDDVSVIDFNLSASAGPDKNIFLGDSAFIGRPPEIGLECTWSSGTVSVGSGGGLWVKPTSPGTYSYVVTQNICGNIKTDTVNVNVSPSSINENTLFSNSIALYPQPAKDIVNISLNYFYEKSIEVRVVDVNGKIVGEGALVVRSGLAQMQVSDISDGVYVLELRSSSGQVARKRFVIAR